jgi:hypothetical protein
MNSTTLSGNWFNMAHLILWSLWGSWPPQVRPTTRPGLALRRRLVSTSVSTQMLTCVRRAKTWRGNCAGGERARLTRRAPRPTVAIQPLAGSAVLDSAAHRGRTRRSGQQSGIRAERVNRGGVGSAKGFIASLAQSEGVGRSQRSEPDNSPRFWGHVGPLTGPRYCATTVDKGAMKSVLTSRRFYTTRSALPRSTPRGRIHRHKQRTWTTRGNHVHSV